MTIKLSIEGTTVKDIEAQAIEFFGLNGNVASQGKTVEAPKKQASTEKTSQKATGEASTKSDKKSKKVAKLEVASRNMWIELETGEIVAIKKGEEIPANRKKNSTKSLFDAYIASLEDEDDEDEDEDEDDDDDSDDDDEDEDDDDDSDDDDEDDDDEDDDDDDDDEDDDDEPEHSIADLKKIAKKLDKGTVKEVLSNYGVKNIKDVETDDIDDVFEDLEDEL